MTDPNTQAPPRLLDDPALDSALRSDLELASSHGGVAYDVDAGLARFQQTLLTAPSGSAAGAAAVARVLGWLVGATVLVGGVVGAERIASERGAEQPGQPTVAARAPVEDAEVRAEDNPVAGSPSSDASEGPQGARNSESVAEVGVRGGAGDAGAALEQAEGGSPALDASAPPRPASKSTSEAEPTASLADEAKLINEARKTLANDPAKALALTQTAEQQFPEGAMIQERRGYAILALVALGRLDEAHQRAGAYLERWPNGPLSRRVRDALGL